MEVKAKKSMPNRTFGEALDRYIEARENLLSPRTIRNYKYIRSANLQELMPVQLRSIDADMIQRIINQEAAKYSPKTVRDFHGLIYSVLQGERPDLALNTVLPAAKRPKLYIPSDDDVGKVLEMAGGTEMEIPILLAAFGPMRRGEICALHADDISGNVVHVTKNMVLDSSGKWVIKTPKTYSGDRYIAFPDFVARKLNALEGHIVNLNPDMLSCRFRRLIKSCSTHPFRFHDLRHYSASIMHAIGVPDAYIMQRGGWGNDIVLKSIYRHVMDDKMQAINQAANSYFEELCNTKCNTKK